jgi:hypothetical protein
MTQAIALAVLVVIAVLAVTAFADWVFFNNN